MIVNSGGAASANSPFVMFDNYLKTSNITATSAVSGDLTALKGAQTFDRFYGTVNTFSVGFDLLTAKAVDFIGIASHNLGTLRRRVSLDYSANGVTYTNQVAFQSILTDAAFAFVFPVRTARYWRLNITNDVGQPAVAGAGLSVCFLGQRLVLPAFVTPPYVAINHAARAAVVPSVSLGGQYLGSRVRRVGGDMDVNLSPVGRAFVESNMAGFEAHYDASRPFFWASSPEKYPLDLAYCWRSARAGELRPAYDAGGRYCMIGLGLDTYGA